MTPVRFTPVKVALSGATFAPNSINAFYGHLTPDGASFDVNEPSSRKRFNF